MKKVFQTKLKSITKVLTLVIVASLATFTGCKSYDEDIDKLNTDMKSLETSLTTKITELNAATVAATDVKIAALTADITALKTRVTALETNGATDAEVTAAIAAAKTDILNKTVSLEALTAYKTEVAAELAALKTKVDAAATQAALTALSTDVNGKIVEVNKTITTLGADVDALEALVAKANTDLAALSGTVGTTVTNLAALKADVNARLATLEGVLTISNGKSAVIDDIKAQLTSQLALINTNKDEIAKTKTELANQKTAIEAAYTAAIVGLKTELLAAIKATGDNATAESAALSKEITKLKASIAALVAKDAALEADLKLKALDSSLTALLTSYNAYVASNDKAVADLKTAQEALAASTYTKAEIDAKLAAIDKDLKDLGTALRLEFEVFATRQLAGLMFVPEWVNDGFNAVEVGYIVDIPTSPLLSVKALFTQDSVTFRFNPTTANLTGTTWKFINNSAIFNAPGVNGTGDESTLFASPALKVNADGSGRFLLKVGTWSEPAAGKTNYFALQANKVVDGKASQVVSDYVKVMLKSYTANIANKKVAKFSHYPSTAPVAPVSTAVPNFKIQYDALTKTKLTDLVWATANNGLLDDLFENYNFKDYKWEFSKDVNYAGQDGVTNQNAFININESSEIEVLGGTSSIGRYPLVKVKLLTLDGKLIKEAYIMFKIVNEKAPIDPTKPYEYPVSGNKEIDYNLLFNGNAIYVQNLTEVSKISWTDMNKIYEALQLNHTDFKSIYGTPVVESAKVNGVAYDPAQYPAIAITPATLSGTRIGLLNIDEQQDDVDTYAINLQASPYSKFGENVVVIKYTPVDVTKNKVLYFTFKYTVKAPVIGKAIKSVFYYDDKDAATPIEKTIFTQGTKFGGNYVMELGLGEAFGYGADFKSKFDVAVNDKIDGADHDFIVTDPYIIATVPSYKIIPSPSANSSLSALLGVSNTTGVRMSQNSSNPLNVPSRTYPVNFKTTYINGEVDDFNYFVVFKNPLEITLSTVADFNLLDIKNAGKDEFNATNNYVVKMLGDVVVDKGVLTAKASDYGLSASFVYSALNIDPSFDYAFDFTSPNASWENGGTKLTSPLPIADLKVTYNAPFAIATRTDAVTVDPDLSSPVKRK